MEIKRYIKEKKEKKTEVRLRRLQQYPLNDPDNNQLPGGTQDGGGCQALASCFAHDKKNQPTAADLPRKRSLAVPQCTGKTALCSVRITKFVDTCA